MSQASPAAADCTWVEMEVQKGDAVSVYRGRVLTADLDRWRSGELVRGALTLFDVYWSYEAPEGEGWVVVGSTAGPYSSAAGSAIIRADLILVVLPLLDGSDREAHRLLPRRMRAEPDA
jgi:hypothetical protein